MSLKTIFLVCFAIVCLPAIGWSAWIAARAQSDWAHATAAVRMAEAMGDALRLLESLSIESGLLQESLLSDGPISGNLAAASARHDGLLDNAQRSMQRARLPDEAVTRSREVFSVARAQVAEAVSHPLSERDPVAMRTIIAQLYERRAAIAGAVARAERDAAQADARVGELVAVGSLAVDIRAAAGWRSSNLSAWFGGVDLNSTQLDEGLYLTGKVQFAWERLQRQVLIVGEPPHLAAAIIAMRDGYFRLYEPRYREILAIARAGGPRPMALPEWRGWTVKALAETVRARDAAITEAVNYGTAAAVDAEWHLAGAAAFTLGLLVLGGGTLLVLLRRLVLPMQRLTAAVTRLAAGDVATIVPERERRDEIGAMAAAIEVFRETAVELRLTNLRFDAALSNMSQGLAMYDADENLVVTNTCLCELAAVPPGSLHVGMTYREVLEVTAAAGHFAGRSIDEVYAGRQRLQPLGNKTVSFEEARGDRLVSISSRLISHGGWLFTLEDITERHRNEARISHIAHHDALTGLPNRVMFRARLEEALVRAGRGEYFSLLYLDLDRFKIVNDSLGHPAGDALLQAVTKRLQAELRETDTVARLGGDEFAVLQTATEEPRDATALAQRLIRSVGAPYQISGQIVDIGVSIGIAVVFGQGDDADTLLKNADLALYRAKANGRGTWRFFEPEMDAHMQARRLLEVDLRRAVEADQFEVHYQPVLDLRTSRITGFEALLRWRHPSRGLVSPGEFVPLAEEIGLIGPIGEWVLLHACKEAAGWPGHIKVAVNLSAVQIRGARGLADTISAALRSSGLAAIRLELEITETAMLQDTEATLNTLHRIRSLGVAIAMDDFGTGYSSLSHLRRFPFNRLKIDQTFVRDLGDRKSDCAAIVRAVMTMCASMGISVTAEGVETEAQLAWLVAEGPIEGQGYLFSPPVPAAAIPALIERLSRHGLEPAPVISAERPLQEIARVDAAHLHPSPLFLLD